MLPAEKEISPFVEVLLATFNGSKYIDEQLNSLCAQTYKNIQILVHDDGSTDDTIEIVKWYVRRYPSKIRLIDDNLKFGGPKNNFEHLMALSTANYIAFCDQDDVWKPNKIELTLFACREAEKNLGDNVPIGVFTDLTVVDSNLKILSHSLWKLQGTEPSLVSSIRRLSLRPCVTGCTLLINRAALKRSLPIPKVAAMHDRWISLVILKNDGALYPINTATIFYRQHSGNVIGANAQNFMIFLKKFRTPVQWTSRILEVYKMARKLHIFNNIAIFLIYKLKEYVHYCLITFKNRAD